MEVSYADNITTLRLARQYLSEQTLFILFIFKLFQFCFAAISSVTYTHFPK